MGYSSPQNNSTILEVSITDVGICTMGVFENEGDTCIMFVAETDTDGVYVPAPIPPRLAESDEALDTFIEALEAHGYTLVTNTHPAGTLQ